MQRSSIAIYGRDHEIEMVDKLMSTNLKGIKVLLISGRGGIGKTTLLQTYQSRLEKYHRKVRVVPIIDLAEPHRRSDIAILQEIAMALNQQMDQPTFDPYLIALRELRLIDLEPVSDRININRFQIAETFTMCFNAAQQQRNIVVLMDSAEYVTNLDVWDSFFGVVSKLKQVVLIIAGRPQGIENVSKWATVHLRKPRVSCLELKPLDVLDSTRLLKKQSSGIKPSLARKIHWLTQGMPVVMMLAADRLRRGLDIPNLVEMTEQQLHNEVGEEIRAQFKLFLVDFLFQPKDNVDLLLLWMAHINQGISAKTIRFILGCSEEDSLQLVRKLKSILYVKAKGNQVLLHEDIGELIKDNVWRIIDPQGKQRSELSRKMYAFVDSEISQLLSLQRDLKSVVSEEGARQTSFSIGSYLFNQDLLKDYIYDQIRYALDFDPAKAHQHYYDAFDTYRIDLFFQNALFDLMSPIDKLEDSASNYRVAIRRARLLTEKRDFISAEIEFSKLSERQDLDDTERINLLSAQANLQRLQGDLLSAIKLIDQAISIARQKTSKQLPGLIQTKGFFMRRIGRFDEAARLYIESIERTEALTESAKVQLANVMNNLAFVLGAQGDWLTGFQWCEQALKLRQEVGTPSEVAASLVTRGSLYWAKGDYNLARQQYDLALQLVEIPQDSLTQARAFFGYGIADWFAEDYLKARHHFEKAIAVMKDHNYDEQLPLAIHNLGHVEKELGNWSRAEELYQKGYELSDKYSDHQALADTLVGFAELYYQLGRMQEIQPFVARMEQLEEQGFQFPLFAGRMSRLQGEIAFDEGDWVSAANFFVKGLVKISRHGGYGKYSLSEEFLRLSYRMDKLSRETAVEWCELLETKWPAGDSFARREMEAFIKVRRAIAGRNVGLAQE